MTIPTMVSIKEASRQTGISYEFIRQLIRERKIIYVRAGVKFLVNMESLVDYLSTGEQHDGTDQERA
ncbi:excisionase family DNA-binding protein [Faecalicatena fissicatena]|uniref:excisionase family DNA-binding protein n=1 Tax=Faecalicatena fissicatena TaxID=290055 RepID=UPI001FB9A964|nr:excisionase family DNA-binding protein [Faecalicatena fissicatena]